MIRLFSDRSEYQASRKNIVGGSFEDLAAVIALVDDKSRIGVCFDTCHGFAAGYDLRSEDAYNETWRQFDDIIGLKYLKAFHVNDSMKGLGSGRDLHQNIGKTIACGCPGICYRGLMHLLRRWRTRPVRLSSPDARSAFRQLAIHPRDPNAVRQFQY